MNNINKNKFKSYAFKVKQTKPNYISNKYHNHTKGKRKQKKIQETTNSSKQSFGLYTLNIHILSQDGFVRWQRILQINLELFLTGLLWWYG